MTLERTSPPAPALIRMLIGGQWRDAEQTFSVSDPYRKGVVALAPASGARDADDALAAAHGARATMAAMPAYERAAMLRRAADNVSRRADEIARAMTLETGKAIRDSLTEV